MNDELLELESGDSLPDELLEIIEEVEMEINLRKILK